MICSSELGLSVQNGANSNPATIVNNNPVNIRVPLLCLSERMGTINKQKRYAIAGNENRKAPWSVDRSKLFIWFTKVGPVYVRQPTTVRINENVATNYPDLNERKKVIFFLGGFKLSIGSGGIL